MKVGIFLAPAASSEVFRMFVLLGSNFRGETVEKVNAGLGEKS